MVNLSAPVRTPVESAVNRRVFGSSPTRGVKKPRKCGAFVFYPWSVRCAFDGGSPGMLRSAPFNGRCGPPAEGLPSTGAPQMAITRLPLRLQHETSKAGGNYTNEFARQAPAGAFTSSWLTSSLLSGQDSPLRVGKRPCFTDVRPGEREPANERDRSRSGRVHRGRGSGEAAQPRGVCLWRTAC